jgi:hypothetical protein
MEVVWIFQGVGLSNRHLFHRNLSANPVGLPSIETMFFFF